MKLGSSLERLIIRDTENRRLNDEVPYGQVIETKNFFEENSAISGESSSLSSSLNVSLSESHNLDENCKEKPVYFKRTEIEPSEDEVYSYVRIEQLRYRWE
jgi:hypothetical protein